MTTLGSAIDDIRTDLNRDTTFNARIQSALITAIRFYRANRFDFNTKRKSFQLSGEYTSLTSNFMALDSATLTIGNRLKTLKERTFLWINEMKHDVSLSSEPCYFGVEDSQLRVYPPPDQSYSCEIHYCYDLQDISASTSDTATANAWFREGYELIRHHAMVEMLEVYIGGEEAIGTAQTMRSREAEIFRELKKRSNRKISSGSVRGKM